MATQTLNQTLNPMTGMFEQISDSFGETLKGSMDFQDQTSRFWKNLFDQSTGNWREQLEKCSGETLPFGKTSVERFQRMFDEQAERTVDLLHDTFELGKAETPAHVYGEMMKLWRKSFDSLRESNEAFAKNSADMFEQFSKFARGCAPRVDSKVPPKPTK